MPLLRHIAGFPTATEQRCVRCCEVIIEMENDLPCWPGQQFALDTEDPDAYWFQNEEGFEEAIDCTPHDPHTIDEFKDALREALETAR